MTNQDYIINLTKNISDRMPFTSQHVLMVKPNSFCLNEETFSTNSFQSNLNLQASQITQLAQIEQQNLIRKLLDVGISVTLKNEILNQFTPDALFPNNWFCHLPQSAFYIFPMLAQNRRLEVQLDWIKEFSSHKKTQIIDLRHLEQQNLFLEGTGSLIFDHENKIVYAALSPRTHLEALNKFCSLSGYTPVTFHSYDCSGKLIYHTNVMMAMSPYHVVINLESITSVTEKKLLHETFIKTKKEVITITNKQMNHFCGNILFLKNNVNETYWVMSSNAYDNFASEQIAQLTSHNTQILHSSLNTIETVGGGGVRCLMAELF